MKLYFDAGGGRICVMDERQQAHIIYYPERLGYWEGLKPQGSAARLQAAGA